MQIHPLFIQKTFNIYDITIQAKEKKKRKIMQNSDEENFEDQYDQNDYNDYEYEEEDYGILDQQYNQDDNFAMNRANSTKQHYELCERRKVLDKINEEILKVQNLTNLPEQWAIQLLYLCHWSMDTVYNVLDGTFKKLIHYVEGYDLEPSQPQECMVCLEINSLYKNPCGHQFCLTCWKLLLEVNLFQKSELFPKCQGQDCPHLMSYSLIKMILIQDESINQKFEHLLFIRYSKENPNVKMCPIQKCSQMFQISDLRTSPMWCSCKRPICTLCGYEYHFPITCAQFQAWKKLVAENEKQWIEIVKYKICPACKDPIQKNQGCNHMTCRCKHQFCWICLKDWKTHGVCTGREAHDKMEEQRKKRQANQKEYRERFQQAQSHADRMFNITKRIEKIDKRALKNKLMEIYSIPIQYIDFLVDIIQTLPLGYRFCYFTFINVFFKSEESLEDLYQKRMQSDCDQLDNYLQQILTTIQSYDNYKPEKQQETREFIKGKIYQKRPEIMDKTSRAKEFILKVIDPK